LPTFRSLRPFKLTLDICFNLLRSNCS